MLFTAPCPNSFFTENFYQFILIWNLSSGSVAQGSFWFLNSKYWFLNRIPFKILKYLKILKKSQASWITPIYSSFQNQKEKLKIICSKSVNPSSKTKFTVPYSVNRNLSRYWLFLTMRNQKTSQNEKEPIPSKVIHTQGVEIDLKATICTRNNNFQNKA